MNRYFFLFIVYELLIGGYLYDQYLEKIERYHSENISSVKTTFTSAVNAYQLISDKFYTHHADTLAALVVRANGATVAQRDDIREKLLDQFGTFYSENQLFSLDVFHIFDAEGRSLLRFHEPEKHDDLIINKRHSIRKLQKDLMSQSGLEIGVYKESFRFQYPLFFDGRFVGSYEYGIRFDALIREMEKIRQSRFLVLLLTPYIDAITRQHVIDKRYHRIQVGETPYYMHRQNVYQRYDKARFEHLASRHNFAAALQQCKPSGIDYLFDMKYHSVIIDPIYDIEGRCIGSLLGDVKSTPVREFFFSFFFELLLATLLSLLVYYAYFKEVRHHHYVRDIINTQRDILIVTDGAEIKDANQSMLHFFGYETLSDFMKEHACICDFFIPDPGYLSKAQNGINWAHYVFTNPHATHLVKMYDQERRQERIFNLQIQNFKGARDFVVIFKDVTEEIRERTRLEEQAHHDMLTHIYNRNRFEFYLDQELKRGERYDQIFSLIMFDIDHFKEINDTYGHAVGDVVLQELTALIATHIRDIDLFARWGGEEFMIISHSPIDQAEALAHKLRELCEHHRFNHIKQLTCSFGVTQYRKEESKESLIKRVDDMLYTAKNSGRNCVVSLR